MKKNILRALIEIGFILALYYANLLMGEFIRSGQGFGKGLVWALLDIFTMANFIIAIVTACFAYVVVEFFRTFLLRSDIKEEI